MPFPLLYAIRRSLNEKRFQSVDVALMDYFKKESRQIEAIMLETFPNRAAILKPHSERIVKKSIHFPCRCFCLKRMVSARSSLLGSTLEEKEVREQLPRHGALRVHILSSLLEPLRVAGALMHSRMSVINIPTS